MNTCYRLVLCIINILLFAACNDNPFLPSAGNEGVENSGGAVIFRASLSADTENKDVRGIPVTGTTYPDGGSFGVLGYRLPQGTWQSSLTPDFMYNRKVTRQGDQFLYEGTEYWPATPVRFFAYHPYLSSGNGIEISPPAYAGSPYLRFTVKDTVTEQIDLLLASPAAVLAPLSVSFPFAHGLTRVAFLVNKASATADVKVTSIALKNIIGAGTVSLLPSESGKFSWTPSDRFEDVKEYVLSIPSEDGTERGLIAPDNQNLTVGEFHNICSPNGTLFLIPQQITAGRSLLVVHFTVDGNEHTQEVLIPATTPGSPNEWSSGKFIRYQLTVNSASDIEEVTISVADALANCILLDPTPKTNPLASFMEYSIPVLQANIFYENPAFSAWNKGTSAISPFDSWGVNVIWMDKANLLSIVKSEGRGANDDSEGRFTVRISRGNEGNALLGIYKDLNGNGVKDEEEDWLWSWHLWVTDYNPNRLLTPGSLTMASAEGEWEVANGKIHRYRDARSISDPTFNNGNYGSLSVWEPMTGLYAGKAMMDRNLGSVSEVFPPLENNIPFENADVQQRKTPLHVLYYEYGRKDPFLSNAYRYKENGSALNTIDFYNQSVTLLFSIQNPEKYICGRQSWAIDKPSNCYWYDPRHQATTELSADTGKKSLFDPCPAGWRLPVNGTWSDYSHSTFQWNTNQLGRIYKPSNSLLEVLYPAEGFRVASTGEVKQTGYHGIYWTCSPIPANDRDYCFRFSSYEDNILEGTVYLNVVYPSATVFQTDSFSVRCVQDE